ncbi:MAG: poly-gamma-glutamate synthase PgsB [Myxococcota bacterium]
MTAVSAEVLTALAILVVGGLALERWRHRRNLMRIPVRVHVNGTRGKSSVTRLVASGLRAGGVRVVAKTTGTVARVILPNERELSVHRPLGANVREQIRVVRLAAEQEARVLVIECMALQPILQWLSERMFVRATHGVITNARPDHLDVMGPGDDDVARALCGMVPRGGVLFTAEQERLPVLAAAAKDRASELIALTSDEVARVRDEDIRGFPYHEHRENVALALRICEALGVDRETALRGMRAASPDPGALRFYEIDFFGRQMIFVNAFAANDPLSSQQLWDLTLARYPESRTIAVFNCRVDRPDRSRRLGESLGAWRWPDQVLTVGSGTVFFHRAAGRAGFDTSRIIDLQGAGARETFERLVEMCEGRTVVVGLGNIGGLGLELTRLCRNRAPSTREKAA